MSTNWGAAQFSRAPDTLGSGVQDRGVQKIYRSSKTYFPPNNFWEPTNYPSMVANSVGAAAINLPFLNDQSPYYFIDSSGTPRHFVFRKRNQTVMMKIKCSGWMAAGLDPVASQNSGFHFQAHPRLGSVSSYGSFGTKSYVLSAVDAGSISRYLIPFQYEQTYFVPMASIVETLGITDLAGTHGLTIHQKDEFSVGVTAVATSVGNLDDDARLYFDSLETEISVVQNLVEFENSERSIA